MTKVQSEADQSANSAAELREAERRKALGRLRELAARLDHQAGLIRNGGFNPKAEAEAGRLADDAFAIRWALRRIGPETEAVGQVFESLHALGRPPRTSARTSAGTSGGGF